LKHIKKVELLLLIITILLAVICGVLVYEFVFKSYLTSSNSQTEVQTTNNETTELVYRELSQLIFAIRGYYYLRKELPEELQQIDVNTTYNYQYAFEELEDAFRIELRGNVAISKEESLMKENSLDGELYTTYENFLYTTIIDKVFED
jgi:glycine cleavage system protein P-like pyridoxal-binding family